MRERVKRWGDMLPLLGWGGVRGGVSCSPRPYAGEGVGGEGKDIEKRGGISNNPASK